MVDHNKLRNQLMDGAIKAVAIYGLEGLTTRSIEQQCKLKDSYIYRYFEDKEDLLKKAFLREDRSFINTIETNFSVMNNDKIDFKERCYSLWKPCWQYLVSRPDVCKFYVRYYYSTYFAQQALSEHTDICKMLVAKFADAFPKNVRLEFGDSTKGSYYAPCGTHPGASKSAICIDYNSPTLSSDIVSLVGQHVFYHADDGDYEDIKQALKKEGNNALLADNPKYQEYLNTFREGVYIPEGQDDERLSEKGYKKAARFFVECFVANVNQDESTKAELKKLFPKSYAVAMNIIEKQTDTLTFGGN